MSEMVERCADALLRAYFDRPIEIREISVTAMDQHDLVRAVIEAMREPTEAMKSIEGVHWGYGCHVCGGLQEGWEAMIDEALK